MKNFNIFWGSLNNPTFKGRMVGEGGGVHEKQCRGGRLPKKEGGGLGQFADLRRRLGKKVLGSVF